MKHTLLVIAVMALGMFSFGSNYAENVLTGESLTNYGSYQLTQCENCTVIDDVAYKTWTLTYSNSDEAFKVLVSPAVNGNCHYLVKGENFEIAYVKENGEFGVKMVDGTQRQVRRRDLMKRLNYDSFLSQEVLTKGDKSEQEYLGLTACFLPLLLD
ncbi:MAG: hypothetical protein JW798_00215 [Prolixibacteraceae bacterium]|nr:hypothetical protein [Prolixibacteraceae bacterium]